MAKTILVGPAVPSIEDGRRFLELLSENKIKVKAALWQKSELSGDWKLLLVVPLVEDIGLKETYRRLDNILSTVHEPPVDLMNVSLRTPEARFYKSLHRELKNAHDRPVSRQSVGDHFIEEGYIYFVK